MKELKIKTVNETEIILYQEGNEFINFFIPKLQKRGVLGVGNFKPQEILFAFNGGMSWATIKLETMNKIYSFFDFSKYREIEEAMTHYKGFRQGMTKEEYEEFVRIQRRNENPSEFDFTE